MPINVQEGVTKNKKSLKALLVFLFVFLCILTEIRLFPA